MEANELRHSQCGGILEFADSSPLGSDRCLLRVSRAVCRHRELLRATRAGCRTSPGRRIPCLDRAYALRSLRWNGRPHPVCNPGTVSGGPLRNGCDHVVETRAAGVADKELIDHACCGTQLQDDSLGFLWNL